MMKLYRYVGPEEIRQRAVGRTPGFRVESVPALAQWFRALLPESKEEDVIGVTFVVDEEGWLRVADRRSEHVACAEGRLVFSAGEMFFDCSESAPRVVEVSNHSTGFCPEPESWPAVAAALDRIPLDHPGRFTREVVFRRCLKCGQRNLVKDKWFVCGMCQAELPKIWNF
jgi:hypothetical protein